MPDDTPHEDALSPAGSPAPPGAPSPFVAVREQQAEHPIRITSYGTRRRSRLTVLVRSLLVTPHLHWLFLWGLAAFVVVFLSWLWTLVAGRSPRRLHGFLARFLRYSTHVSAYITLLANPYPHFVGDPGDYPVDLEVDPPAKQRRWKTLFRFVLAVPALVLSTVFGYLLQLLAFAGWFVCLVIGRMPEGMQSLGLFCVRYGQQTLGYLLLLTDRYPALASPAPPTGEWQKPEPGWKLEARAAGWIPPEELARPAPGLPPPAPPGGTGS